MVLLLICSLSSDVGIITIAFKVSGNWLLAELYRNKIIFSRDLLRKDNTPAKTFQLAASCGKPVVNHTSNTG